MPPAPTRRRTAYRSVPRKSVPTCNSSNDSTREPDRSLAACGLTPPRRCRKPGSDWVEKANDQMENTGASKRSLALAAAATSDWTSASTRTSPPHAAAMYSSRAASGISSAAEATSFTRSHSSRVMGRHEGDVPQVASSETWSGADRDERSVNEVSDADGSQTVTRQRPSNGSQRYPDGG